MNSATLFPDLAQLASSASFSVIHEVCFLDMVPTSNKEIHGKLRNILCCSKSLKFVFQFCVSVHHIMINKNTSLMQLISIYFTYSKSLYVSGRTLPIIRRMILYISATGISPLKLAEEASGG